ncbi:MAG: hypothetical protein EXR73_10035 [Myxococcales bacterium]|nr:hypothetical protein [Myxococcales bacterium]
MFRRSAPAVLVLLLAACGPGTHAPTLPGSALAGLPDRQDPQLVLDDDDDLRRARNAFDALAADAPQRHSRRRELFAAYRVRIDGAFAAGAREDAFGTFTAALSMWDARELAVRDAAPDDLALTESLAVNVRARFSRTGGDLQTATALAVLIALHPAEAAALEAEWAVLAAFGDELATAEHGPGAERARPIELLEEITSFFPSPWAGRALTSLYLDRQQALQSAVTGGHDTHALAVHREGIMQPVYNLVRLHARLDRLHDAPAVVDALAGQIGDDPPLREALTAALGQGATGAAWQTLAEDWFIRSRRYDRDIPAALKVCAVGARRLPDAPEPRACLGTIAYVERNVPAAIHWFEEHRRLRPDDRQSREILAALYDARLSDHLVGERLVAARADLERLERFHAGPGAPLDPPLSSAWVTFGRGLYNLGEIDEARRVLERAHAVRPSAEALEFLGMIDLKEGRPNDAALRFAAAAALPRDTPIEQAYDKGRLLRFEGEARAAARRPDDARRAFVAALVEWDRLLGARLDGGRIAAAQLERARVLDHLGRTAEAVRALEEAIDQGEQAGVYSDAIAFLVARGQYDAARDAFLRQLARPVATEYFKIYPALWLVGLARLRGLEPDPLALEYLRTRSGTRWYHDLARFATGQLDWPSLLARATTRGRRAEAFFYEAVQRIGRGDRAGGEALFRLVLDTRMYGFYEYDLAVYFLRHGTPR